MLGSLKVADNKNDLNVEKESENFVFLNKCFYLEGIYRFINWHLLCI